MISRTTFWITYIATIYWCLCSNHVYAHCVSTQAQQYIKKYRDLAIAEMFRTGIPASIKLAQGMFESQNGISQLASKANNHFGVKCKEDWRGDTIMYDDDAPQECFRKYSSVEESFIDHSNILQQRDRYAALFLLSPTDYQGWAKGLKESGYATLPNYAEKIINIIEQYKLYEYDLGGIPEPEIAEKLNHGESGSFVAHAKKGAKPKRSTATPKSDLASLDRAFSDAIQKRPNIPLQQLSGAPAVMPNAQALSHANTHRHKHEKNSQPPIQAQPQKIQNISDITAEEQVAPPIIRTYNKATNTYIEAGTMPNIIEQNIIAQTIAKPIIAETPLPTPAPDPTPEYLMPQYEHQTILYPKSDKQAKDNSNKTNIEYYENNNTIAKANIITVAERATTPIKKLSPSELAAERRKESALLPPQKLNYVNGANTVTYPYEVSILQIAKTYKLSPEQVVKYNDLKSEEASLPARHNIFLQAKADKSDTKTHLVETGETLWTIAQKYGITLHALCEKNKLTPKLKPLVGEKLYLKNDAPKTPKFDK